jgi:outer membrane protein TolC
LLYFQIPLIPIIQVVLMRVTLRFSICCILLSVAVTIFATPSHAAEPLAFRRAIDLALRHSTTMAIASADTQRAHAAVQAGRNLFLPRVDIGSGLAWTYGFPLSIEGSAPSIFNVTTQQFLFNPSQHEFLRAYESDWKATTHLSDDKKNQVILETATDYVELDTITSMLSVLQQQNQAAQRAEEVVSQRVQAGIDSQVELTKAKLASARVRMKAAQALSTADLLRQRLSQLTGLPVAQIETASESIPKLPEVKPDDDLVEKAVAYSPVIKAANEQAVSKGFAAKGEHKALYPSIDLAGQYGYFTKFNNYDKFFLRFQRNNATYGLQIRVPIFNSAQKARAQAADQDAVIARKQAEDTKNQVSAETLRLERSINQLAEAKEVARLEHELAQSEVEAMQARIQAGTATLKDQEQARVREHETYITLLDAAFAVDQAQMQLLRATGDLEHWAVAPETGTSPNPSAPSAANP